jgi:hypothetical protein
LFALTGGGCAWCPACFQQSTEPPPPTPVKNVLVYWDQNLHVSPDPTRQGAPLPGMACRVWIFGEERRQFLDATGLIQIDLFDMTDPRTPKNVVSAKYFPEMVKLFKRTDTVGPGYTLFVPWPEYDPKIKDIKMQLTYYPDRLMPFFDQSNVITLHDPETPAIQGSVQQVSPAVYKK